MEPACNIELKARLSDLRAARKTAQRVATDYLGVQEQTDTYFHCPQGRLKLREIVEFDDREHGPETRVAQPKRACTQLISYDRADQTDAKESHYQLIEISDPARVRELKSRMGVRAVVTKRREVFLHDNVRIHLDEVTGLGTFLEFEAVLGPGISAAAGQAQVATLRSEFGLSEADLIADSYIDMLLREFSG